MEATEGSDTQAPSASVGVGRTQAGVAVLIPAFDCQSALDATIAALPDETPLHVLVVDDGSRPPLHTTRSGPHEVRVVRNSTNQGIHGALRRGMEVLSAEGFGYVARLDAGDFALPGRFARQRAFLEAHPDVVVVGSACEVVDGRGSFLYVIRPPLEDVDIRRCVLMKTCLHHTAVMFRAEAVMKVGNYRGRYPAAEDLDLFLRLLQHGEAANLPQVLTRYGVDTHGISLRNRRRQVVSTLRLQMAHLRPLFVEDWVGLLRGLAHLFLPRHMFERFKSRLWRDRPEAARDR